MPTYEKPTFESIVLEHGAFIRRTLAQLGVPSRDLGDVQQEVLRGVSRRLPLFDPELSANPETAVRGWVFAICERQAANHRRKRRRRGELFFTNDELDTSMASGPDSEERVIVEQRKVILMELLEHLEPQRRAVIVAYELEGIPMADVAAAFSISVNTAWNRLRLAREDLREAWDRMEKKRRVNRATLPLPPLGALLSDMAAYNASAGDAASGAGAASQVGGAASQVGGAASQVGGAASQVGGAASQVAATVPHAASGIGGVFARAGLQLGAKALFHAPLATVLSSGAGLLVAGVMAGASMHAAAVSAPTAAPSALAAPSAIAATAAVQNTASPSAEPAEPAASVLAASTGAPAEVSTVAPPGDPTTAASVRRSPPVQAKPPRDVAMAYETTLLQEAQAALDRGDVATAERALQTHQRSFALGKLAGEREYLYMRLRLHLGRRNEAIDHGRRFLAASPQSSQRGAMEKLVGPLN